MRLFTVKERIQDAEFLFLENETKLTLPNSFKSFLKVYGGLAITENNFFTKFGAELFQVGQFMMFDEILNLTKELWLIHHRHLIPFAFDPGGWHFCLCMDNGIDSGGIFVNRWTDHLRENQLIKIANSFEEFIEGLTSSQEGA